MPAPTHLIIVSPLDKLTAVQVKWGVTISPTAPDIYTLADAAPRSATHKVRSGSATSSQLALAQAHINTPDPDLEGVVAALWPRDQPSPYVQLLADNGLTTDPNA